MSQNLIVVVKTMSVNQCCQSPVIFDPLLCHWPAELSQSYKNFYAYSSVAPKDGYGFHLLLLFVNTEMMKIYLDELIQSLDEKEIILIMDQVGWHKSKALVVPKNVDIWVLPPFSPELNPVERLGKMLKRNTLHNRLYDSLKQLEKAVVEYFDTFTPEALRQLCSCSYIMLQGEICIRT